MKITEIFKLFRTPTFEEWSEDFDRGFEKELQNPKVVSIWLKLYKLKMGKISIEQYLNERDINKK